MGSKNKLEILSECFKGLSAEDIQYINENKTEVSYLKGETIFKQGAFAHHVLFVNQGLVKIYLQIGKNKQINIRLAKKGDYIAYSTIFDKNIYQYSALSISDSKLCMIEKSALRELILRNSEFAVQLSSKNSIHETRYLNLIKNLSFKQMRGKLASALLYLSSEEFHDQNIFHFLSRQDIADFASISMESTVKFLKEFERDKLIALDGKEIEITNKHALTEIDLHG